MTEPVLTKADFCRRYARGEFGNASPTWENLLHWFYNEPWDASRFDWFHIRNRKPGGKTLYNVHRTEIDRQWYQLTKREDWYISAMAPTSLTLIQGEVQRAPWGLYLYWSNVKKPMREALAESSFHSTGLDALRLLQGTMNPESYEWLQYLLEEYPGHVVEFSVYDQEWGTVPGHNVVFWECRLY